MTRFRDDGQVNMGLFFFFSFFFSRDVLVFSAQVWDELR